MNACSGLGVLCNSERGFQLEAMFTLGILCGSLIECAATTMAVPKQTASSRDSLQ